VRLVRLIKAPEIASFFNEQLRSEQLQLLGTMTKVILVLLIVAHYIACVWYAIGRFATYENTWLKEYEIIALETMQQYTVSFHWSLAQFSGEMIYMGQNNMERVFMVIILFGAILMSAWFISSITTTMTQLQMITSHQTARFTALRRYLVDQCISRPLAVRVQRNAQYEVLEAKKNVHETSVDLLRLISNPLLVELHFEINGHVLMTHPFFENYHDINPGGIRKVCHVAVHGMSVHPGDVLFRNLEVPTHRRMFFVVSGELDYLETQDDGRSQVMGKLQKGDWFCEGVLWTTWTHVGTLRANTESQLLALESDMLPDIIGSFPSDHVTSYSREFIRALNDQPANITDMPLDEYVMEEIIDITFPREDDTDSSSGEDHLEEEGESFQVGGGFRANTAKVSGASNATEVSLSTSGTDDIVPSSSPSAKRPSKRNSHNSTGSGVSHDGGERKIKTSARRNSDRSSAWGAKVRGLTSQLGFHSSKPFQIGIGRKASKKEKKEDFEERRHRKDFGPATSQSVIFKMGIQLGLVDGSSSDKKRKSGSKARDSARSSARPSNLLGSGIMREAGWTSGSSGSRSPQARSPAGSPRGSFNVHPMGSVSEEENRSPVITAHSVS